MGKGGQSFWIRASQSYLVNCTWKWTGRKKGETGGGGVFLLLDLDQGALKHVDLLGFDIPETEAL